MFLRFQVLSASFNLLAYRDGLPISFTLGELVGGTALIVGFYARYVPLLFVFEMLGVIYFAHWANGWVFTNKGGGWEYPAFWAVALFVQFLLGDGLFVLKRSPKF